MKLRTLILPAALLLLGAACSASPTAAAPQIGSGAAHETSPYFGSGAGVASPEAAASFNPAFGSGAGLVDDSASTDGPLMGSGG